ncbi:MAG: putative ABC transporter permease subunit [Persicimonas sp.]
MIDKLIGVKLRMVRGGLRSAHNSRHRAPLFVVLSAIFWVMLFRGTLWIVEQAIVIEPVGELLIQKLLSIAFLVFLGLLIFSNIVTAFTTFYLADDLQFLMSKPIPRDSLFSSRFIESLAQSSWIVLLFGTPVFIATGVGVGASWPYYTTLAGVLVPFVALPTALASLIALGVTNTLRANRTRDAMLFFGLVAFSVLFILVRALRPERLLNPDSFESIGEMLSLLSAPTSAYLPSDWCLEVILPTLFSSGNPNWWSFSVLWMTPLALYFIAAWCHRHFYERGYSKAQEGRHGASILQLARDWILKRTSRIRGDLDQNLQKLEDAGGKVISALRVLVDKDQKVFLRDASQWSQLLVVIAIIVIYLVNYKYFEVAADEALFGDVGLFFFNLAACGFVVVALSGRFLFPSVSIEGRSFWLILQAPISLEKFLVGKWLGAMTPVIVVGQLLIWSSNLLVVQNWFLMLVASVLTFLLSLAVAAMAVGLGAVYPQFHNPNAAKIASSFGAVIYMILGMFVVLIVLACTFRTTMHWGAVIDGKDAWPIGGIHYVLTVIGLLLPLGVAAVAIRIGAAALRRRM